MKIFKTLNFSPTNVNLYYEAFTHTSYSNENPSFANYERLEFLGDAILDFIISEYLYKERQYPEGVMTRMRARYVCEEALATYAKDLKFEADIKLGSGEIGEGPNDILPPLSIDVDMQGNTINILQRQNGECRKYALSDLYKTNIASFLVIMRRYKIISL